MAEDLSLGSIIMCRNMLRVLVTSCNCLGRPSLGLLGASRVAATSRIWYGPIQMPSSCSTRLRRPTIASRRPCSRSSESMAPCFKPLESRLRGPQSLRGTVYDPRTGRDYPASNAAWQLTPHVLPQVTFVLTSNLAKNLIIKHPATRKQASRHSQLRKPWIRGRGHSSASLKALRVS